MENNKENVSNQNYEVNKEIDLIDLLRSMCKGVETIISKMFSFLGLLLRLAYQKKYIVLFFVLLGIGVGLYLSWNKVYRAEVELKINNNSSYFYKNLIDPLFDQVRYGDYSKLSKHFGITEEEARKIVQVKSHFYIDYLSDGTPNEIDYNDAFDASDTIDMIMSDRLRLVVLSLDTSLFSRMDTMFANYFNQNPLIIKENELKKRQLDDQINAISEEIIMLDSLRKKEYFHRKKDVQLSTDKMLLVEREVKLYHEELLTLEMNKQRLVWDRDVFDNGVSFTSKFEVNPHAVNGKVKHIAWGMVLGFLLGVIFAFLCVKKEEIINYLKKDI
jgi:hypothetical protein